MEREAYQRGGLIEDLRYLKRGTGSGEWRVGNGEEGTGNGKDTGNGKMKK